MSPSSRGKKKRGIVCVFGVFEINFILISLEKFNKFSINWEILCFSLESRHVFRLMLRTANEWKIKWLRKMKQCFLKRISILMVPMWCYWHNLRNKFCFFSKQPFSHISTFLIQSRIVDEVRKLKCSGLQRSRREKYCLINWLPTLWLSVE